MPFQQSPLRLGNQYDDDRVLRSYLRRVLPKEALEAIEPSLREMGRLAGGTLYEQQLADRLNEPALIQWDAWGNRIDRIEVTRVWKDAERLAAKHGLVALAYEQEHGALSRIHQFALAHLFIPSSDTYWRLLAMSDSAARVLLDSGNSDLILEAVPHLTSRNPTHFRTSSQWLLSDLDATASDLEARQDDDNRWRLYGRRRFTSAVTSPMALVLARPMGQSAGSENLTLFFVELKDREGRLRHIQIDRLQDKLGTRKLPTAEVTLNGTPALLVQDLGHSLLPLAPLFQITRTWSAASAIALMRRGLALARAFARLHTLANPSLTTGPLYADTLATLQATYEGAFQLTFRTIELLGDVEAESTDSRAAQALLRVLVPIAKLTTSRQVVAVLNEVLETFGEAGYVEDIGLPLLMREALALPLWDGTTNKLALDTLRTVSEAGGLSVLKTEVRRCAQGITLPALTEAVRRAAMVLDEADLWLGMTLHEGQDLLEAGARRFALAVGRALQLALLAHHAQWAFDQGDHLPIAAVRRLAAEGFPAFSGLELDETIALANDIPPPEGTDLSPSSAPLLDVQPVSTHGDGATG